MRTNSILIAILLDEIFELRHNINRSHLNLQILRIITPNNGRNTAVLKYHRGGISQKITFISISMCMHEENLCCAMINHEHTRRFFQRDFLLRDNVTVEIGTFMSILASYLIIR